MSLSIDTDIVLRCANCGKGEGCELKTCTACKIVKYCNRDCQIAHRRQHKKECKKRAAELQEEALFAQPPPNEDCVVCFLPLPPMGDLDQRIYQPCCGKEICAGCLDTVFDKHAEEKAKKTMGISELPLCPFCRTPAYTTNEEYVQRLQKRIELNDAIAASLLGSLYAIGRGVARDKNKAIELLTQAAELGSVEACGILGDGYNPRMDDRWCVEKDLERTFHYYELAAKGGHDQARNSLGVLKYNAGNISTGMKHFMIAAAQGHDHALENVRDLGYMRGHVSKDDFAKALRAHKDAQDEMNSDQRAKSKHERSLDS